MKKLFTEKNITNIIQQGNLYILASNNDIFTPSAIDKINESKLIIKLVDAESTPKVYQSKRWSKTQVASTLDHSALKPNMVDTDIIEACKIGIKYNVASVCVRPSDAQLASKMLKNSGIPLCVVIGFPHGSNRMEVKALETKLAIEDGATEVDMVMNIGKFLSGDYEYVQKDIEAVVSVAKKNNVHVKVIQETCYLSPKQIEKACKICRDAGADYVKTSTGFGDGPATPEAIEIMMNTVGDTMGVKASGGVRSYATAAGFLEQGCKRLGVVQTEKILSEAPPDE